MKAKKSEGLKLKFDKRGIAQAAAIIRAIDHPYRQDLLKHIARQPGISVAALKEKELGDAVTISQHLAILRHAALVVSEKEGRNVFYWISESNLLPVLDWVSEAVTK